MSMRAHSLKSGAEPSGPGLRLVLWGSVAVNFILVVWLLRAGLSPAPSSVPNSELRPHSDRQPGSSARRMHRRVPGAQPGTAWSRIESTNLFEYTANLRSAGCPDESICDILRPASARAMELRIERRNGAGDFWAVGGDRRKINRAAAAVAEAAREAEKRFVASLGCPPREVQDPWEELILELTVGFAGPEVRDRAGDIIAAADRRLQLWRERSNGFFLPEELEAIRRERDTAQAQLAALLPPALLDEFELRVNCVKEFSRLGKSDPWSLSSLQLTAAEFREFVRIQAPPDLARVGPLADYYDLLEDSPEKPVEPDRSAALKSLLGESRFEEYQRGEDPAYVAAGKLAGEFGQSPAVAREVHALLAQMRSEISDLYARSADDRDSARAALWERRSAYRQRLEQLLAGIPEERRRSAAAEWTDQAIHEKWRRP